jgi:peptidoglycan/LPS O-acetylase OafA/YrhL
MRAGDMNADKRIDALTGVRGAAALLVVYAHMTEITGFFSVHPLHLGEVGVMLFFTLSGFLMAYLYGDRPFGSKAAVNYVISRFSRIAPAYLVVVIASYVIFNFLDSSFIYAINNQNIFRHLIFSGNVSALWSIPPEVQFYAVFLLLWFALWKFKDRGDASFFSLLLAGVFTLIAFREVVPGTFVGSCIQYFFCGVFFGMLRSRASAIGSRTYFTLLQAAALIVVVLIAIGVIPVVVGSKRDMYNYLEGALFTGLFIFIFSFPTRVSDATFSNPFLIFCGECSFSIYLLNIPVLSEVERFLGPQPYNVFLSLPIVLSILAAAWLSYRYVEIPGGRLIKKLAGLLIGESGRKTNKPATATSAINTIPDPEAR